MITGVLSIIINVAYGQCMIAKICLLLVITFCFQFVIIGFVAIVGTLWFCGTIYFFYGIIFHCLCYCHSHFLVGVCLFVCIMASAKLDTKKLDGRSDFSMWRRKWKPFLFKIKLHLQFLVLKYPKSWNREIVAEKLDLAYSTPTLHLHDNVLREIDKKDATFKIWTRLENLYLR